MLKQSILWICIVVYLAFVLLLGHFISQREKKKHGEFNIFKTTLPWPLLVMTYIASLMSVWVFFAGPGGYYRGGLTYWFSEMTYFPLFMIACHFTMNKVWLISRNRTYVTPSDFFYDRFKSPALRLITALIFLSASFPYVTSVMVAIAKGASVATGGTISYNMVVIVIGLTMVLFTAIGGFKSVAVSDTIQGFAFIGALLLIAGASLKITFGGSIAEAVAAIQTNVGNSWFSYPGTYGWTPYEARFGYPFACLVGYTIMLPHVFVRSGYASQDLQTQRKLMSISPILQAIIWTGTFVIGMVGIAAMPGLESAQTEMIIPHIIENIINPIYPGLAMALMIAFFAGATGVGISTADSFLLVAASIVSEDILINTFKLKLNERQKEISARLTVIVIGVLGVLMALNPPSLIFTLIMFAIAIVMPLFPILVYGLYWKRATKQAAIVSSLVGTVLVLLTYFVWGVGYTWYGTFGMAASAVLMPIISMVTKQDENDSKDFYEALSKGTKDYYEMDDEDLEVI